MISRSRSAVLSGPPHAIAHRGSCILWPENTFSAFRGAYDMGFRWMETDLHVTLDGVVICLHDDTLDRTTGVSGCPSEVLFDDLADVDAAAAFRDPVTGGQAASEPIPTFEDAVDAFPDTRWVVDLKQDGVERPLAELVERRGWSDRIVVGSFSDRRLRLFRRLTGGDVVTSTGSGETLQMWTMGMLGFTPRLRPAALQIPRRHRGLPVLNERTMNAFAATGAQIHVWTVNEADDMRALLSWGVGGIITDRPDVARDVWEELNLWGNGQG